MLHHLRVQREAKFQPHRHREGHGNPFTCDAGLNSRGIDIIAIDAVHRLAGGADACANPGIKGSGWDNGAR